MDLILPSLVSFIITLVSTPLTIKLAKKYGLVDDPNFHPHPKKIHTKIIPRAGGLPIYIGTVSSVLFFLPLEKYLIGIILGITILLLLGLADDLIEISPYFRLLIIFLAALAAVTSGIGISFITNPLYGLPILPGWLNQKIIHLDTIVYQINFFGSHNLVLIADIFAFIWIVSLTQIINWSKGVDGQMPGITLVCSIILGVLSFRFFLEGDANQLKLAQLAFIVAGCSLGFLIFNWAPSKILPGFSASTILGFMLATLAILSGAKVATALLVLAIPTVDFVYTILRRISKGQSPVWGDRGHLHHRLLDLGLTPKQISLFYMAGSAILGVIALVVETQSKLFTVILVTILFIGFILWLNSFGQFSKQ